MQRYKADPRLCRIWKISGAISCLASFFMPVLFVLLYGNNFFSLMIGFGMLVGMLGGGLGLIYSGITGIYWRDIWGWG